MEIQIQSQFENGNFRYPSGAIPTHTTITFEIQVPRSYGLKEVHLVWINDENNHYDYIRMNWKGIREDRDRYEKNVEVKNEEKK